MWLRAENVRRTFRELVRRAEPTGLVRGQGVCVCERGVNAILRGCKRPPAGGVNLQVYTPRRRGMLGDRNIRARSLKNGSRRGRESESVCVIRVGRDPRVNSRSLMPVGLVNPFPSEKRLILYVDLGHFEFEYRICT